MKKTEQLTSDEKWLLKDIIVEPIHYNQPEPGWRIQFMTDIHCEFENNVAYYRTYYANITTLSEMELILLYKEMVKKLHYMSDDDLLATAKRNGATIDKKYSFKRST